MKYFALIDKLLESMTIIRPIFAIFLSFVSGSLCV